MQVDYRGDEAGTVVTRLPTFSFREKVKEIDSSLTRFDRLRVLQLNLGNRCNLSCIHCHVGASPEGDRIMGKEVIDEAVRFLRRHPGITLDMTGGCPEMNPHFPYLVSLTDGLDVRRVVRTNLVIATEPGMTGLPDFYAEHGLAIMASLPCVTAENVDRQRGGGVFGRSIAVLKRLNKLGYGQNRDLTLVYNPGGAVLPAPEGELQALYGKELMDRYGIRFTRLIALTNVPVGRFRDDLMAQGAYVRYLRSLAGSFNPEAVPDLMCRSLASVDWEGRIFNCDFNQALGMFLDDGKGRPLTIGRLDRGLEAGLPLRFGDHCLACAAGEGSGCFGSTTDACRQDHLGR